MTASAYVEVLDREECLALLDTVPVGWLSFCDAGRPELVTVNFLRAGDRVLVRSGFGGKVAAAARRAPMALGVGGVDAGTRTGWSATVTGRAHLLDEEDGPDPTPDSWAPGARDFVVALEVHGVSGRRITSA